MMSLPGDAMFSFGMKQYGILYLSSNGYVCFQYKALSTPVSSGGLEDHFLPDKGDCFSFLFANLAPDSAQLTAVSALQGKTWKASAMYVSFLNAPLVGDTSGK